MVAIVVVIVVVVAAIVVVSEVEVEAAFVVAGAAGRPTESRVYWTPSSWAPVIFARNLFNRVADYYSISRSVIFVEIIL